MTIGGSIIILNTVIPRDVLMESIEKHIETDKAILQDPTTNPQMRRHIEGELHDLEEYVEHHKDEIEAGDHHDTSYLELFCDQNPSEPECLVYDD